MYDPPHPDDGERFLVEQLWPRGVTREAACLNDWLKDLAPSPALRRWFGHDPGRWAAFRQRHEAELQTPAAQALLRRLAQLAHDGPVTLVFAATDTEHNAAVVLRDIIQRQIDRVPEQQRGSSRGRGTDGDTEP